ncbi:MAG: hypothetical protein R3A13_12310 [Bdellovibrionota bacterium]
MTNILIIDDCEVFREFLGMVLLDSGHTHVEADGLKDALKKTFCWKYRLGFL